MREFAKLQEKFGEALVFSFNGHFMFNINIKHYKL